MLQISRMRLCRIFEEASASRVCVSVRPRVCRSFQCREMSQVQSSVKNMDVMSLIFHYTEYSLANPARSCPLSQNHLPLPWRRGRICIARRAVSSRNGRHGKIGANADDCPLQWRNAFDWRHTNSSTVGCCWMLLDAILSVKVIIAVGNIAIFKHPRWWLLKCIQEANFKLFFKNIILFIIIINYKYVDYFKNMILFISIINYNQNN